jgi:translation elongation factor EF-1beta
MDFDELHEAILEQINASRTLMRMSDEEIAAGVSRAVSEIVRRETAERWGRDRIETLVRCVRRPSRWERYVRLRERTIGGR